MIDSPLSTEEVIKNEIRLELLKIQADNSIPCFDRNFMSSFTYICDQLDKLTIRE